MDIPHNEQTTVNSGSAFQHFLVALGVGLVTMAILMFLYNAVLGRSFGNSSLETGATFLILSIGVTVLLGARFYNKRRALVQQLANSITENNQVQEEERHVEPAEHFAVPSYEEVVCTEHYNISQFITQQDNSADLPAYEELMGTDSAFQTPIQTQNGVDDSNPTHTCTSGSNLPRLPPLKVRPSSSPQISQFSMEPLTPPPQYEDIPPELPHLPQKH